MEEFSINKISLEKHPLEEIQHINPEEGAIKLPEFGEKNKKKLKFRLNKKFVLGFLGIFGFLFVLLFFVIVIPFYGVYKNGLLLKNSAYKVKASVSTKDISIIKTELQLFDDSLKNFSRSYHKISWMKRLPFVGFYVKDGESGLLAARYGMDTAFIMLDVFEPYADIIGFGGVDSESVADSANDRIDFIIQTIDEVIPRMDEIQVNAQKAHDELLKIDPEKYPEKVRGIVVRENLQELILLAKEGTEFLANSKPLVEKAPYLLGIDDTRRYLLLFQNDKELRPTGGFITAYTIMEVTNGKISPVSSSDIYNLDNNYVPQILAPDPIVDYLKGPYVLNPKYRLRDMNWNPDFKQSMDLFLTEALKAGISKDLDGIIAVDTQVVVNILNVLGPVEVPGFGVYSTNFDERCDCAQVIYELESFADIEGAVVWSENEPGKIVFAPPNYDNRKKIVGPLMNTILSQALGQPKEKLPDLFLAAWRSLTEKHVLTYLIDEDSQKAIEQFGAGGTISDYDGDYFMLVDANLGGRKSNLYVYHEVLQTIEIKADKSIEKTVEITYKNPQDFDGWLNSVLPNWTRIYVPENSELLSSEGFDDAAIVYNESGKTVFAGGFELRPQGVKKITLKYKLPFNFKDKEYELLIQKQSGLDAPLYTINLNKQTEEFYLRTDKEVKFKL